MLKLRFTSGIALLAATVTACGLGNPPTHDAPLPAEPTMIGFADPSRVGGLSTRTITAKAPSRRVHITYPTLAADPALSHQLHAEVTAQLRAFTRATRAAGPTPELNIDWQLSAVSEKIIGVRLRTGEFDGSGWSDSQRTVWHDRPANRPLSSTGLLNGQAGLTTLAGLVKARLKDRKHGVDVDAVTADPNLFDSLAFNRKGDLVAEFDDFQVGAGSLGRVAVAVPRAQAAPLLSAAGVAARAAAETPAVADVPPVQVLTSKREHTRSTDFGETDCAPRKCVALTFNDGPGAHTPRLLSALAARGARATFFVTGSNAIAQPDLLRRMRDEGHVIGNHSWSHRNLAALSANRIADQLGRTQNAVHAAVGQTPTLARAPYGSAGPEVAMVAERMGLSLVRWNVDPGDEYLRDPADVVRRTVKGARPGAIIALHGVSGSTVDAMPTVLDELTRRGYIFVTVPELYGTQPMMPGQTYHAGGPTATTARLR
ncbi:polysaccharide deacetylase family protein [Streptosporangium sp. KLBMP 9127]|nr:polysaccharide deacetylase family protein [Streptosporangium sp. KLBMP 9127]